MLESPPRVEAVARAELVPLARLTRAPWNPRTIAPDRLERLCLSIARRPALMRLKPLLVQRRSDDGAHLVVYAGNARTLALEELHRRGELPAELAWVGEPAAWCLVEDLSDAEAQARSLVDNTHAGDWVEQDTAALLGQLRAAGEDLTLLGFADAELDELLALLVETAPPPGAAGGLGGDEAPDPRTRPGDLWQLGPHRLLCGDGADPEQLARLLGERSLACTFTSPPYGVGLDYGAEYEDTLENVRALLPRIAAAVAARTIPGGYFVVNFGDLVAGSAAAGASEPCEYPMALDYWPAFRGAGWLLWARRFWTKPIARTNNTWTATTSRAACDVEQVWTWKRPGKAHTGRSADSPSALIDLRASCDPTFERDAHDAAFPLDLPLHALRVHSRPGDLIYDPFLGTGTVLMAAEALGRVAVAAELSPRYCDLVLDRWTAAGGSEPALLEAS